LQFGRLGQMTHGAPGHVAVQHRKHEQPQRGHRIEQTFTPVVIHLVAGRVHRAGIEDLMRKTLELGGDPLAPGFAGGTPAEGRG
jgi:hypothetical protein